MFPLEIGKIFFPHLDQFNIDIFPRLVSGRRSKSVIEWLRIYQSQQAIPDSEHEDFKSV